MKIVLTTTLVALLAIGLLGINYSSSNNTGNAFAQMESNDSSTMQDNTEMMGMDDDDEGMCDYNVKSIRRNENEVEWDYRCKIYYWRGFQI